MEGGGKDPYVLEFLGTPCAHSFMLELGKGFTYTLKCFVLIDLKTGMDMYVRLFEDAMKGADNNPTVGPILWSEKDHTVVKCSVLNDSRQLFASQYRLFLPSEEELRTEIERERESAVREQQAGYVQVMV